MDCLWDVWFGHFLGEGEGCEEKNNIYVSSYDLVWLVPFLVESNSSIGTNILLWTDKIRNQ